MHWILIALIISRKRYFLLDLVVLSGKIKKTLLSLISQFFIFPKISRSLTVFIQFKIKSLFEENEFRAKVTE